MFSFDLEVLQEAHEPCAHMREQKTWSHKRITGGLSSSSLPNFIVVESSLKEASGSRFRQARFLALKRLKAAEPRPDGGPLSLDSVTNFLLWIDMIDLQSVKRLRLSDSIRRLEV
jgi:hypothetical protein